MTFCNCVTSLESREPEIGRGLPILTLIYNESLAQGTVPDDWRQANVAPVFKKGENIMQQIIARCRLHLSVAKL